MTSRMLLSQASVAQINQLLFSHRSPPGCSGLRYPQIAPVLSLWTTRDTNQKGKGRLWFLQTYNKRHVFEVDSADEID